jgi:LuxR family maltose regulon positive regulatory protein
MIICLSANGPNRAAQGGAIRMTLGESATQERIAFGELLRRYRLAAGLSQEALAERARTSARTISDLERGVHRLPYKETVVQLADALGLQGAERAALTASAQRFRQPAPPVAAQPERTPSALPLLAAKLAIPPPRASLVPRPHLIERLQGGLRGPLTLLAAPPGCGKTSLLSAWRASPRGRAMLLAWVALDAGDNDPLRFWSYILSALDGLAPGAAAALALLEAPQPPPIEVVLTPVLNALSDTPKEMVLALDDYHVITERAIHQGVGFLLEHLPSHLHLLLASRADPPLPLARLRASGAVTELRAADLRFSAPEAAAFLTEVMGLPLDTAAIAALEARTEGWIAGLQLAALSLQGRPAEGMAAFIAAFTGSHRHVVDYLVEEVLERQAAAVQTFLLRTSILDRLCAPLCAAVVGAEEEQEGSDAVCPDSPDMANRRMIMAAQRVLEGLERGNVFVVGLDEERQRYRYHHLFAEVLRSRVQQVQPRLVPELHRRASAWFERQGLTRDAIAHALAAGSHERAAVLLEPIAVSLYQHGEMHTLRTWLSALPDPVLRARPRLCLAQASLQMNLRNLDEVEGYLQDAERAVQGGASPGEARAIEGAVAGVRVFAAAMRGDPARVIEQAGAALDRLDPADTATRGVVAMSLGMAYAIQGDLPRAAQSSADAVASARLEGPAAGAVALVASGNLTYVHRAQGRLHLARATCQEAINWAATQRIEASPLLGTVYLQLADLAREWHDLAAASGYLPEALARLSSPGLEDLRMLALIGQLRLRYAQGQLEGALAVVAEAEALGRQQRDAWGLAVLGACRAQVWLAQGNLPAALRWAQGVDRDAELAGSRLQPIFLIYSHEHMGTAPLQVLLAQGRESGDRGLLYTALARLDQQRQESERAGLAGRRIKMLALQALAYHALGDPEPALSTLAQALALAEPEGCVRLFADEGAPMADLLRQAHIRGVRPAYTASLLAAMGVEVSGDSQPVVAPSSS